MGQSGDTRFVSVGTNAGCSWTATSNATWLTITSASSFSGTGSLTIRVDANPGPGQRTGTLTVAGQTVTFTQVGSDCNSFIVSPTSLTVSALGDTRSFNISTAITCRWTAMSNANWLTITGTNSATGFATVPFRVDANPSTSPRTGTLTVTATGPGPTFAAATITVIQAGQ